MSKNKSKNKAPAPEPKDEGVQNLSENTPENISDDIKEIRKQQKQAKDETVQLEDLINKSEGKSLTICNICGYQKFDQESGIIFKAGKEISGVTLNAWMKAQVRAKILKIMKVDK